MRFSTTLFSATAAILLVLFYVFWSLRKRRKIQLESCATLFLSGPGLVGGVLLLASMYNSSLLSQINDYEIYVGLGGLSLIFTVVQGIRKIFA